MAASGIAEHNEARRKEMLYQKRAYKQKALMNDLGGRLDQNPELLGNSGGPCYRDTYEQEVNQIRKVGSPPGYSGRSPHNAASVDKRRRDDHRAQQLVDYSAKIPNRYSSMDYVSQW